MCAFARIIGTLLLGIGLAGPVFAKPITFEAVCVDPTDCDGDAAFGFRLTFDSSVVIPSTTYNATADGGANLIRWSISSSVGDGFRGGGEGLDGIDGLNGDLLFLFDGRGVLRAIRDSAGPNVFGFDIQTADLGFFNWRNQANSLGPGTTVTSRQDFLIGGVSDFFADNDDIRVAFRISQGTVAVPLPRYSVWLMALLALMVTWRYRGMLRARR